MAQQDGRRTAWRGPSKWRSSRARDRGVGRGGPRAPAAGPNLPAGLPVARPGGRIDRRPRTRWHASIVLRDRGLAFDVGPPRCRTDARLPRSPPPAPGGNRTHSRHGSALLRLSPRPCLSSPYVTGRWKWRERASDEARGFDLAPSGDL